MIVIYLAWAALACTVLVSALLSRRSRRAFEVAMVALAVFYLPFGAVVHAWNLATDVSYSGFADLSAFEFVTETWESLVVPHDWVFIGLLVVFEATVGVLVLLPGLPRRVGLFLIAAFHVALVSFGWPILAYVGPMLLALVLLLRAERLWASRPAPTARHSSVVGV